MATVHDRIVILKRKGDLTHFETARDLVLAEMREHPEFEHMRWTMDLTEFNNGTGVLRIRVRDKQHTISPGTIAFFIALLAIFIWIFYG
jgi:hypothetical protein